MNREAASEQRKRKRWLSLPRALRQSLAAELAPRLKRAKASVQKPPLTARERLVAGWLRSDSQEDIVTYAARAAIEAGVDK